jgi:glycosyltransferase involved in cell wall biosynthesis
MTSAQTARAASAAPDLTPLDVTIVLPCRNEEQTVGHCTTTALAWLTHRGLTGEIIVVDNASTDHSAAAARTAGARVIHEPSLGYGTALRTGIRAARGRVIIMADADGTYDLSNLDHFYDPIALYGSHDMVVGDRFAGGIEPLAMTWLHRAGNRALSGLARRATRSDIRDMHCGLRSFTTSAMEDLPAWSTGMEFATHTITHAHRKHLRITQTPTTLHPQTPGRRSHLRPVRDGLRHLAAIVREASEALRTGTSRRVARKVTRAG